jgi:hypothetical protein
MSGSDEGGGRARLPGYVARVFGDTLFCCWPAGMIKAAFATHG